MTVPLLLGERRPRSHVARREQLCVAQGPVSGDPSSRVTRECLGMLTSKVSHVVCSGSFCLLFCFCLGRECNLSSPTQRGA